MATQCKCFEVQCPGENAQGAGNPEEEYLYHGAVNEDLRLCDGFTLNARAAFQRLLRECGLVDVFRHKNPRERAGTSCGCAVKGKRRREVTDAERAKVAIRLDFFLVDERLMDGDPDVAILSDKWSESDHCPIALTLRRQTSTDDNDGNEGCVGDDIEEGC